MDVAKASAQSSPSRSSHPVTASAIYSSVSNQTDGCKHQSIPFVQPFVTLASSQYNDDHHIFSNNAQCQGTSAFQPYISNAVYPFYETSNWTGDPSFTSFAADPVHQVYGVQDRYNAGKPTQDSSCKTKQQDHFVSDKALDSKGRKTFHDSTPVLPGIRLPPLTLRQAESTSSPVSRASGIVDGEVFPIPLHDDSSERSPAALRQVRRLGLSW